jgi:hypothetical protein
MLGTVHVSVLHGSDDSSLLGIITLRAYENLCPELAHSSSGNGEFVALYSPGNYIVLRSRAKISSCHEQLRKILI